MGPTSAANRLNPMDSALDRLTVPMRSAIVPMTSASNSPTPKPKAEKAKKGMDTIPLPV